MRTGAAGAVSGGARQAARRAAASQLEHPARLIVDQVDRGGERLVLVEAVLGDQAGQEARVEPAGHVVPGRDRAERPGVVDEPRQPAKPADLGDRRLEVADRVGLSRNHHGAPMIDAG